MSVVKNNKLNVHLNGEINPYIETLPEPPKFNLQLPENGNVNFTGQALNSARIEPRRDSLSIAEFKIYGQQYVRYLERKSDGSLITARDRKALIQRFLGFLEGENYNYCGPKEIEDYFYHLRHKHRRGQTPLSPASIASYYRNLKPVFTWFVEQRIISENPFEKVHRPKNETYQKEPLSESSVDALLAACATSMNPERDEALLVFLLDTGCRNSEVRLLQLKDINLNGGFAKVLGKGNKKRQISFNAYTAEKIQIYLKKSKRCKGDNGILFRNRHNEAFTKDGLCDVIKRLAQRAGLSDDATVHAFRRTFAVEMLRGGANLFAVQRGLGHTDLKTTQVYSKIAQSDLERQHRLASPANRFLKRRENQNSEGGATWE